MSYCINPKCPRPQNPENVSFCQSCGSQLVIEGRYWVLRPLGKGGFGQTYEVNESGIPKVLKVLTYNEPTGVRLFQQEAHVLMRLRHPGLPIVEPDGYFTFTPNNSREPLHCLVMEKIEGLNLQQWLKNQNHKPLGIDRAIDWLEQLARILHLVHTQNYFHRD
ncbi:serine/threonine protein kinase, partial [Kamptonema sp. PCC 6506]